MAAASQGSKLLVIVGPTASGKSALALRTAKKFNGEIISADSWLVYKGFDIGTAKPTKEDQKQIKHHLIDVAEANDGFNSPLFKKIAEAAIADIKKRGKLPIIVGGTGLYIDSLLYDYSFLPTAGKAERARLNKQSLEALIKEAQARDIDLSGVDLRNKRRVIRAIEAQGQKPTKKALRRDVLIVGINPSKQQLIEKIEERIEQMFEEGLEEEVRRLVEKYGWNAEPMKGIGYREFKSYFEGTQTLEETKRRVVSSTTNLAKKQRTWFKRNKFINWFDNHNEALKQIRNWLNN